ncbi:MAG: restriction endonuclease [bacterium]
MFFNTKKNPSEVFIVKANGEKELFRPEKLEQSLTRSGANREAVETVVDGVIRRLKDGMPTGEIYRMAFTLLNKEKKVKTAFRYSLRRAVSELGPTGFTFEKFVAEIFKTQGYEAVTNQIVRGYCVDHEVDVVAWNEKELIMVEAKFHNDLGMKSDLKVALYVKARFEDLGKMTFDNYGGKGRKLTDGWLVTNTKFTQAAIEYGMCQNLKMVGWNFPPIANLHNMIEMANAVPITILTTISNMEKQNLIARGIVLCRQIKDAEMLLHAGVNKSRIDKIMDEVKEAQNVV